LGFFVLPPGTGRNKKPSGGLGDFSKGPPPPLFPKGELGNFSRGGPFALLSRGKKNYALRKGLVLPVGGQFWGLTGLSKKTGVGGKGGERGGKPWGGNRTRGGGGGGDGPGEGGPRGGPGFGGPPGPRGGLFCSVGGISTAKGLVFCKTRVFCFWPQKGGLLAVGPVPPSPRHFTGVGRGCCLLFAIGPPNRVGGTGGGGVSAGGPDFFTRSGKLITMSALFFDPRGPWGRGGAP